ncbi:MAG: phosphoglycerate kinase [Peptococcaceae bacterium]|nr:phosphoglycerate kinase [Peptococcaceae bacterium]
MKLGIHTLDDYQLKGKVVLCRVDINSPINHSDGRLKDATRIERCLPTIRELSEKGAKTVLLAHQGGDLEYKNFASLVNHAGVLSELLGRPVKFIDDVCGPAARAGIKELNDGEILLLENVRYMSEEMTLFETKLNLSAKDQSKTIVVSKLAPLADLYVCDAFAAAHRSQPTLVGFEEVLPAAMGRLFEEELSVLSGIVENPGRPCLFILGGAKIQDAFIIMSKVLSNGIADEVLTGGLVSNIMLKAHGTDIGEPSAQFLKKNDLSVYIGQAKQLISSFRDKIIIPEDLAYDEKGRQEVGVDHLPVAHLLTDIGHKTVKEYAGRIKKAKTIFINGPMGVFEKDETDYGTRSIWNAVADADAFSIIGGGDSIAAINKFGLKEKFSYICTAGGGLVRFLSGDELPVVKALREGAVKFPL